MAGMKGKVNVNALKKFQNTLEKLNETQRSQWNESALKELANRLLAKVKPRTPVGKKPDGMRETSKVKSANGKSKSFLTARAAALQSVWSGYQGGTLRRGWTIGEIKKDGDNYTIEFINPVEYAQYVEFGHRQTPGRYVPAIGKQLKQGWVNGKFMLTISEQELQVDAPGILTNKLQRFIKEVFQ